MGCNEQQWVEHQSVVKQGQAMIAQHQGQWRVNLGAVMSHQGVCTSLENARCEWATSGDESATGHDETASASDESAAGQG